ncbi:hypothetical protein ACFQ2K_46900 [Streptomyces sanglieri]|uniref:Uncharacterized protein n=1 Tax=Streptomyces sanglieri TaxID=193460 RepID=A0ABW2X5G4_9ACTN
MAEELGAGHGDAERDALKLGRQMQPAALRAASDRGRPGRRTPSCTTAVNPARSSSSAVPPP